MNGPVVSHCGWSTVEFRPDAYGWDIWSAGQPIGRAHIEDGAVRVDTERSAFARPTVERAAIRLAELLHEDLVVWQSRRAVRCTDVGLASGEVA